jgi:hypothetical protein
MSKIFSTNVFVRGHMAFYEISSSKPDIYHLNLKICRILQNPPPKFIRMQKECGVWQSLDLIPEEFLFIVKEIGNRISSNQFKNKEAKESNFA